MIQRNIIFSALLLFVMNFTSMFAATPGNGYALVTLPAGTKVSLTLNQQVRADEVAVGNAIDFTVRTNVTVNGKVVIAAGSIAEGWVKNIRKGCKGECTEITITVENVQAVDGQRVNLRSIPHVMKAPCCHKRKRHQDTTINIGTNLSASVLDAIKINA